MAEIIVNINGNASNFNTSVKEAQEKLDELVKKAGAINIGGNSNSGIKGASKDMKELGNEAEKVTRKIINVIDTSDKGLVVKGKEIVTNVKRSVNEAGEAVETVTKRVQSSVDTLAVTQQQQLKDAAKALAREEAIAKKAEEQAKKAADAAEASAKQWRNWYATMYAMRALTAVFNAIKQSVKEAVNEIKTVDSALTTVQMVTKASDEEIQKIGENAYEIAEKYGKSAGDYLEGVVAFARAGYGDMSESLAELSTKAQLVGGITADVANQMLLSVDAAYKYKGSITELSAVLDGMNEISNKYATSIDNISAGLGKVSSIAAMSNVGIDELSSALGTITAVTQRSGEESATALRAIFLNIVGDTKTEIEDGAKWTAGEIVGMKELVAKYCGEMAEEAQKLGKVLNPMEVIGAFSKAWKDGTLTEAELVNQLSDIGGKLRTSQLMALIQNWDMYEDMLITYRNAAGSANDAYEIAINSWEAKTERMKTAWTKSIAGITNTDLIKGGIDAVTGLFDALDGVPMKILAIGTAIASVAAAINLIKGFRTAGNVIDLFKSVFAGGLVAKILAVAAGLSAVAIAIKAISDANTTEAKVKSAEEAYQSWQAQERTVKNITSELEVQKARIQELISSGESRTSAEDIELAKLQAQTAELEAQLAVQKQIEAQKKKEAMVSAMDALEAYGINPSYDSSESFGTTNYGSGWYWDVLRTKNNIYDMLAAIADSKSAIASLSGSGFGSGKGPLGTWEAYLNEMESAIIPSIENLITLREQLSDGIDGFAWGDMSNEQKNAYLLVAQIDEIIKAYTGVSAAAQTAAEAVSEVGSAASGGTAAQEDVWFKSLEDRENKLKELGKQYSAFHNVISYAKSSLEGYFVEGGLAEKINLPEIFGQETIDGISKTGEGLFLTKSAVLDLAQTIKQNYEETGSAVPKVIRSIIDAEGDLAEARKPNQQKFIESIDSYYELSDKANMASAVLKGIIDTDSTLSDGLTVTADNAYWLAEIFGEDIAEGATKAGDQVTFSAEQLQKMAEELLSSYERIGKEAPDWLKEIADSTDEVAEEVMSLIDWIDKLNEAFENIGDGSEKGDAFETLMGKFQSSSEIAEGGKWGSRELQDFLNVVVPGLIESAGSVEEAWSRFKQNSLAQMLLGNDKTAPEKLKELYSNAEKLSGIEFKDNGDGTLGINVTDLDELSKSLGISKTAVISFLDALDLYNGDMLGGFSEDISEIQDAVNELEKPVEVAIESNTDSEAGKLAMYTSKLDELNGKTVIVNIKTVGMKTFASGTRNAPGGLALVNEEGAELISQNGKAFIANSGMPSLVNLSPGAIVLNARETAAALRGGTVNGEIDAFASGFKASIAVDAGSESAVKTKKKSTGRSSASEKEKETTSPDDYFSKVKEYYDYVTAYNERYTERAQYQIELLQNQWDDLKEPIDKEIEALDKINERLSRQITLMERERDALTKPLNEQIEAMRKAKEITDEEKELEERRLAVEEARKELESANQERTIRYWNKEKGQWEWIADQEKIKSAQESLKTAEQNLADYEYELQISALERQVDAIEERYQTEIDKLDQQQQDNDDKVYELNQQLDALEEKYTALQKPYEDTVTQFERQLAAWEETWKEIELSNTINPELAEDGITLGQAINGSYFEQEKMRELFNTITQAVGVTWLKFDKGGIANGKGLMAKATDEPEIVIPPSIAGKMLEPGFTPSADRLLNGLGVMFGASGVSNGYGSFTSIAGANSTDNSNTYIVNGLTLGSDAGNMTVKEMFSRLAIYAG